MKDENQPPQPGIDPAMEARIVASVLGETSAFEAAEIERLVVAHPELALFKRRIEATHALVETATRPENPRIQLSPERRRKLLETIGVPAVAPPKKIHALAAPSPWWSSPLLVRAAACLIMTGLAVALLSSITLEQTAPSLADLSEEDGGFGQSVGIAIAVPEPQHQTVMPSSSVSPALQANTLSAPPVVGDIPMTGRLFRPDVPSFSPPAALAVKDKVAVSDGAIVTMGSVTAVVPDFEKVASQELALARLEEAPAQLAQEKEPLVAAQAEKITPEPGRSEYASNKPATLRSAWVDDESSQATVDAPREEVLYKMAEEQRTLNAPAPARPNLRKRASERPQPVEELKSEGQKLEALASLEKASEDLDVANQSAAVPAVTTGPLHAGQRSAGTAISVNAVDALLFAAPVPAATPAEAPGGWAQNGAPVTKGKDPEKKINQPVFSTRDGKVVEYDGFINYGSPIASVTTGEKFSAQALRDFKYPTEFEPPQQAAQAQKLQDEEKTLSEGAEGVDLMAGEKVTTRSGAASQVQVVREFAYPTEFQPPAQVEKVKKLLSEAEGFADTGRFELAHKRYEQTLAADPDNIAARKGMEKVKAAREKYSSAAYNEARGRMLMVDAGWALPVRKFDTGSTSIIEQPQIDQSGRAQINRKLDEIVIPRVDFQDVTVREALDFLKSRAVQLDASEADPANKGVNVVLNLPEDAPEGEARITLGLTDIPLRAAFNYVAAAANLKTKVEPYAVSLVLQSTPTDALLTKEYQVPADFLPAQSSGGAREFLEASGVVFPPGATAYYLRGRNKLIVKNTATNLELVDTLTAPMGLPAPASEQAKAKPQPRKAKEVLPSSWQGEILTAKQPFSTFSLHVSDVSFQLAKDALARGAKPDPERIRAEEFYNAFDYNDPAPGAGEEVACRIEQAAHPLLQQRYLVRIAVKVAAAGRATGQPLRLTILLDTSGSMEREDRAASVRRALQSLVSLLGPNDRVTLIGFARTPRLLAEDVPGDQGEKLIEAAASTPSQGGTNLEEALALASELALKHKQPNGQNRIVLLTDGAANLGNANPERLAAQIDKTRQHGISFDACGVGAKGLNDEILEALTRKGDGRYYFLNKPEDADEGFARQLAGAFRPAAENVKVQVVFNPDRVARYRLIGFEKHLLKQEDFRNDKVQAAELSAEEAGVALYQIEPLTDGSGELGEVFVRFRDPATGKMVERSWTMPYEERTPSFDQAPPSLQLATSAALLAENLRGDEQIDLPALAPVLNGLRARYGEQERVRELLQMFERVRR